jgi:large subunit ribosomal protein L2
MYRRINFFFLNFGIPSFVQRVEYDPSRSSFISLNIYKNGLACYELQTKGVSSGSKIYSYLKSPSKTKLKNGDSFFLKYVPEGSMMHSVEQYPFFGSQYSRAAGTFCTMIRKYFSTHKCLIQLKSGLFKILSMSCKATLGCVSNSDYQYVQYGKAGRSR